EVWLSADGGVRRWLAAALQHDGRDLPRREQALRPRRRQDVHRAAVGGEAGGAGVSIDRDKLLAGLAQEQRKTFQYVRRVNARDGKPKHIRARAIEMPEWLLKHMSRSLRL